MTVSDGNHRYPVAGNRQRLVSIEDQTIRDAFTQHPDGKLEEVPADQQPELLKELESQRRKGGRK